MLLGRFKGTYQIVSRILAEQGVAVLLFDLFGLGGRAQTGHRQNFDVFGCGTTICGLMILEAIGLYNALEKDPRFDQKRMGLIGHSGGGQNSIFLSASLYDRVALTVCSGWACSYEYGARKARYICECNLFPGILHEFETWHALGCMFPKPLLICSGNDDSMIARDVVLNLKARMESIYGGNPNLETYIWAGSHPWAGKAFRHVSNFVLRHFGMDEVDENVPPPPPPFPECLDAEQAPLPADCLDLVALAERLTGKPQTGASRLEDVFPAPPFLTTEEFDSLTPEWRDIMVRNSLFL